MDQENPLLNSGQLSQILGVAKSTVTRWYHAGVIPAEIAENQVYRFDLAKVRAALAERARKRAEG